MTYALGKGYPSRRAHKGRISQMSDTPRFQVKLSNYTKEGLPYAVVDTKLNRAIAHSPHPHDAAMICQALIEYTRTLPEVALP